MLYEGEKETGCNMLVETLYADDMFNFKQDVDCFLFC